MGSSYSQSPQPKKKEKKNMILIQNSQVDQERIGSFLRTAETLQIKGLADHPLKEQCQKTSSVSHQNSSFKNDPHPLPQTSLLAMPDQQDNAADYSPLLKRPRHSTGPNSSPLPCRQVFSSIRLFRCFTSMSYLSCAGNPPLKELDTTGNESESLGYDPRARNLSRRTSTRAGSCRTGTTRAC